MQDVSAIVVDIAVIDPKSKVLLTDAQDYVVGEGNWLIILLCPGHPSRLVAHTVAEHPRR